MNPSSPAGASPTERSTALEARVVEALRGVIDPEIGLDVVDLGLLYGGEIEGGHVRVRLTMTTPACPLGEEIARDARERVRAIEGVLEVVVELVWEPPWTPERMSASAKEDLGWSP